MNYQEMSLEELTKKLFEVNAKADKQMADSQAIANKIKRKHENTK